MKEKLKTIKDLKEEFKEGRENYREVYEEDLKQEAIKWHNKLNFCCNLEGFAEEEEIQKWIVHFFNLKQKDLK